MTDLPPAPRFPVDDSGAPRFGAFAGEVERVDWTALRGVHAHGRLYRALHHKRWHYVSIAGPRVILACCIIDVGYASNAFGYLFDRRARRLVADFTVMGRPGAARVSDSPGVGARSTFRAGASHITLARDGNEWSIRARGPGGFDVDGAFAAVSPSLCAVARLDSGGEANCTHKTVGMAARGTARAGGETFELDGHTAALDHTSGLLARDTRWRWAFATSPRLSFNVVDGFNGPVENVAWLDGRIVPLGPVDIQFTPENSAAPWHVRGAGLDLTFTPAAERRQNKNLIVAISRYVQPIGAFSGTITPPGGAAVTVDDLPGVTEDHVARW